MLVLFQCEVTEQPVCEIQTSDAHRQAGRQMGRHTERQTERQADRQKDRKTGRQTDSLLWMDLIHWSMEVKRDDIIID